MVGIGGVVTYKNAGVARSVEKIPLERIVLETDCPYLTPVPMRGKRNDSSYLAYIAEKIAQVKGVTLEEVAEAASIDWCVHEIIQSAYNFCTIFSSGYDCN